MRTLLLILALTLTAQAEPLTVTGRVDGQAPSQPRAAYLADGTPLIVFGAGNAVYVSRLAHGQVSEAVKVGQLDKLALGMRRGPRVAVSGDSLVVTAMGNRSVNGEAQATLVAWRSNDEGRSWSDPVAVHDYEADTREGLHDLAAGADGRLVCVWLDLRSGKTELFGSLSTDGGKSWQADRRLYRSPSGSICECCHPNVSVLADGTVGVLWRNSLAGNRDMYFASFTSDLAPKSEPAQLGQASWRLDGCPMDGGDLALREDGKAVAVWRRGSDLFLSEDTGPEQKIGSGLHPVVGLNAPGPVIAWQASRRGDLMVLRPGESSPLRIARRATFADLATSPGGPTLLVWEQDAEGGAVIMASDMSAD